MSSDTTVTVASTGVDAEVKSSNPVPDMVNQTQQSTTMRSTLYRHPTDKMVGGVCGGIGEFLGWDPTLVRVLWIVATLTTGGGGFLAYLALWMLLPVGTAQQGQLHPPAVELNERNLGLAAKILIALGIVWLLANVGVLPSLWRGFALVMRVAFWPALLIGIGYLLLRNTGNVNWRFNWGDWQSRMRTTVKTPTRVEIRSGLRQLRNRIPLKRSRQDKLFLGVCGGIGQTLGIDANLVRLIWAAFSIGSVGMGVLVYMLLGWVLPEDRSQPLAPASSEAQPVQVIDGTASYKV